MDVGVYRNEFAVTESYTFFNHAAVAPPSRRAQRAVSKWLDELGHKGVEAEESWRDADEMVRVRAARFLKVETSEIAVTSNTSHGLGLVANGIDWKPGDEVVICRDSEYPSNVFPWLHLADRGVRVVEVSAEGGGMSVEAVADALTERTRLVSVSAVQFATGHRTPLGELGALCKERDVLLCVDAIQQMGAFELYPKELGIHFVSACSHKWMLGFSGVALLYVDESVLDELRPTLVGWKSVVDPFAFDSSRFELRYDAGRLESGSQPWGLEAGLSEAIGLLEEVGVSDIGERISMLLDRADAGLRERGCDVLPDPRFRAGILTFAPPGGEVEALATRLRNERFSVSVRRGRVRISPHFYNTTEEIDRLLDVVGQVT